LSFGEQLFKGFLTDEKRKEVYFLESFGSDYKSKTAYFGAISKTAFAIICAKLSDDKELTVEVVCVSGKQASMLREKQVVVEGSLPGPCLGPEEARLAILS
jgi:hypothetical protein